jgi:hypothetical protein
VIRDRRHGAHRDDGHRADPLTSEDHHMTSARLGYKLRDVARSGGMTTAQAIAAIAGIDDATYTLEAALEPVLAAIDRAEDAAGRPLLSAVVVLRESGLPRASFFTAARAFGLHPGSDDRTLWERELRRVHDYWFRNQALVARLPHPSNRQTALAHRFRGLTAVAGWV